MKALSIRQPWAWLIVNGFKAVENRSWDTKFRGEFLIHTGLQYDDAAYDWIKSHFPAIQIPDRYGLEHLTGGIVGKARLIGTVHLRDKALIAASDQPWFFGEYGFMLDDARPVPFIPCKGRLGFFETDYKEPA